MKKNIFFIITFIFFSASIVLNIHKIKTDFFSLLDIDTSSYKTAAIKNLQNSTKNTFSILVKDKDNAHKISELAISSNLFKKNTIDLDRIFDLKLVLFNNLKDLKDGVFFENSIKKLYLPSSNLKDDFFSMINFPKLINADFDIQTGFLKTKNYYLLSYNLKEDFNQEKLLNFYENIKNFNEVYVSSSQIYSLYSKISAQKESSIFGIVSLILTGIFIYFAFSNFRAFYIIFVVIFSLVCGLGMSLILLEELSFLSLVISTSLIGLIVDFTMHFLSVNLNTPCEKNSIKSLRNLFLTALFITTFGYALFFLSPMKFLHQIACISIFSLIFSFLITYFKFGDFIQNITFKNKNFFKIVFDKYIFILNNTNLNLKFSIFIFVLIPFFIYFLNPNLKDDVKEYANLPATLMSDTAIFAKELNIKSDFILVDREFSFDLIKSLEAKNLIENPLYLSSFLNNKATQNEIKSYFKKTKDDDNILNLYLNLGFDKKEILNEFDKIINEKILDYSDILKILNLNPNQFFIENKEIIKASNFIKNDEFYKILKTFNADYVDYLSDINENLNLVKLDAIFIKIFGFIVAFIALAIFLNIKNSFFIVYYIIFSSVIAAFIFTIIGKNIDIFAIFGFILASAAGIDYMLFAFNSYLDFTKRVFGIVTASFTSILSFFMLSFSNTSAVCSFGLSVSLNLLIVSIISSYIAIRINKKGKING
ncbi:hypothetical protein [Campylobacter ureolyticus]|uniref:Membrane transport protein MMPL domain-containing protein n=1 Tax=Campylobacter ureolyticus TaxID=827 RepID=A0A9Q4KKR7_9BACT|nr:hypothetical protein [Campylobacter ureolyticus]MCZ6159419.1 hypothetical protein [Campylobacter ureolyticus]MCZ6163676.1 hypothetical protein [Campylobacter ureolyticus]MCZ6165242.1 hypothetical protein [Campylobacter ureolyticus]MCZ6166713.1 hypothetical protein [Campylobacter ureolyticus]